MCNLHGGGEKRDVNFAASDGKNGCAKRSGILGKGPLVDSNLRDPRTARSQPGHQLGVGDAVFLDSDAAAIKRQGLAFVVERAQQVAPGVGLWHDKAYRNTKFLQPRDRLRAARDNVDLAELRDELFERIESLNNARERARAHTR